MPVKRQRETVVVAEEDSSSNYSNNNEGKLWPPWPFNLISKRRQRKQLQEYDEVKESYLQSSNGSGYQSAAQVFWAYFRQRARIGARQVQQVGSDLWFNLSPAAPPLLLLSMIPRTQTTAAASGGESSVRVLPLFGNGFARNLALGYLGVAILSWSHYELNRKRRLVPLPLKEQYQDIERALLPPFLPAQVPDPEPEPIVNDQDHVEATLVAEHKETDEEERSFLMSVPPRLRRQLRFIYDAAPTAETLRSTKKEWSKLRDSKRRSAEKIRRQTIMDELLALRSLRVGAEKKRRHREHHHDDGGTKHNIEPPPSPLGHALITGASRGIGRAIAVELARWEIPLILVARDLERLTTLANEIETCYGVHCSILQADLGQANSARRIHEATSKAGLRVDILINNAGICTTGLAVDMPLDKVQQMIQVNTNSVAMLNHLYGKDMKQQRRGRIMVVSSVVGCTPSGPQVATYAATKAFEKTLSLSMGKELEPFGVGVTCLMPGAVRDTYFRSDSGTEEALCWHLPFYTRTAQTVAHQGVRAMLLGQTEVTPGWQNRAFVKLVTPMLPQRLTSLVVEAAWTPFQGVKHSFIAPPAAPIMERDVDGGSHDSKSKTTNSGTPHLPWRGLSPQVPPRLLVLPTEEGQHEHPKSDEDRHTVIRRSVPTEESMPFNAEESVGDLNKGNTSPPEKRTETNRDLQATKPGEQGSSSSSSSADGDSSMKQQETEASSQDDETVGSEQRKVEVTREGLLSLETLEMVQPVNQTDSSTERARLV